MASSPIGFAEPENVAPVLVALAATVVTEGAAVVVKDWIAPKDVAIEFAATAQ